MKPKTLLAFLVWAIDSDNSSLPVTKAWEEFLLCGERMKKVYTDPQDLSLYCPAVVKMTTEDFFSDYVLFYAKAHVVSGCKSYGKLNDQIRQNGKKED